MEDISENIRKWKIKWTINAGLSACPVSVPDPVSTSTSAKTKLCLDDSYGTDIEYVIWNWDTTLSKWLPVDNISECADFLKPWSIWENKENICRVLKVEWSERFPLTNSYVAIEKLDFYLTNDTIPKVTVIMTVRPALGKWLASNLLKASTIQVQTTISERSIKTK